MLKKINRYLRCIKEATELGEEIGQSICDALKPIIPDLDYSVGWTEAGVDTICFWSKSHQKIRSKFDKSLEYLIEKVFPELEGYIETPFGVILSAKEAEEAFKLLTKLRDRRLNA